MKKAKSIHCNLAVISLSSDLGNILCILKLDYIKNYISDIDVKDDKVSIDINWKISFHCPMLMGK